MRKSKIGITTNNCDFRKIHVNMKPCVAEIAFVILLFQAILFAIALL